MGLGVAVSGAGVNWCVCEAGGQSASATATLKDSRPQPDVIVALVENTVGFRAVDPPNGIHTTPNAPTSRHIWGTV